ncbi:hypothetical protein [Paenibacillus sp. SI8]|uniref:hypothetical protein n=1 Tax=unclassified Paenibacillus TaxID=185978 RepID=UPI003465390D
MSSVAFSPNIKNVISMLSRYEPFEISKMLENQEFLDAWSLSKEEKRLVRNVFVSSKSNLVKDEKASGW